MIFYIMAIFEASILDSLINWAKAKYKWVIMFVVGIIFLVFGLSLSNEYIKNDKIKFTETLINIQKSEELKNYDAVMNDLKYINTLRLNHHQRILVDFYTNKIRILQKLPQKWETEYISRVNQFKDPNYSDDALSSIFNGLSYAISGSKPIDCSFSIIGELSLILRLDHLKHTNNISEARNFIMYNKAQGLPNYILWLSYAHFLETQNEILNARLNIMQVVLYGYDYLPEQIFKSVFFRLLFSLKSLK